MVRELNATEVAPPQADKSKTSLEQICALADRNGIGEQFRAIHAAAERHGLYPRLWRKSVMYAPLANRARMLFTVWAQPRSNGRLRAYIGSDVFPEFYPVGLKISRSCLGQNGWRDLKPEDVRKFIAGLDKLFGEIELLNKE